METGGRESDDQRDTWAIVGLATLAAAFLFRVVAQLLQAVAEVDVLPAFGEWHSGVLPYPVLVAGQAIILGLQAYVIARVAAGRLRFSGSTGAVLHVAGLVYLAAALLRLVVGLTVLTGHSWFDAPLPSIFHVVLASFVVLTAWAGKVS
jgi:hypothetical protein